MFTPLSFFRQNLSLVQQLLLYLNQVRVFCQRLNFRFPICFQHFKDCILPCNIFFVILIVSCLEIMYLFKVLHFIFFWMPWDFSVSQIFSSLTKMCLLYLCFLIYLNVCRASSTSYLITFVSFGKFLVSISLNSSSATFSSFWIPVTCYTFLLCPMCPIVFYVFHNFFFPVPQAGFSSVFQLTDLVF